MDDCPPVNTSDLVAYLHLVNAPPVELQRHPSSYLAERLGVSVATAYRAIERLRGLGLVAPRQGGSKAAGLLPVTKPIAGYRIVKAVVGFLEPKPTNPSSPRRGEDERIRSPENGETILAPKERVSGSLGQATSVYVPVNATLMRKTAGTVQSEQERLFPANRGNSTCTSLQNAGRASKLAAARPCKLPPNSRVVLLFHKKNHTATNKPVCTPTLAERKRQAIQNIFDHLKSGKKPRGRPPTRKALILAALYIKRRKRLHWDYNPEPRALLSSMMKAVRLLESVGEPPSQWGAYLDWLFEHVEGWTRGRLNVAPVSWVASESRVDAWSARADRKRVLSFKVVDRLVARWWPDPKDRWSAAGILCWTLERDLAPGVPSVFGKEPWREAYAYVWEHRQEVIDGGK